MEKFGLALRNIRQSKGITIKQAANEIVTPAFLSKFERGKSEMSFSKLVAILDHINIDIDEFILEANNFAKQPQSLFLSNLAQAVSSNSIAMINTLEKSQTVLYQRTNNVRYQHNIYLCHLYVTMLSHTKPQPSDWEPIKTYLLGVQDWVYYEFLLYANTIPFLPTTIIQLLSRAVYQKGLKYMSLTENKSGLAETLLNTIETLLKRNKPSLAIGYVGICEPLFTSPESIFERLRLKFYHSAIFYLQHDDEKGLQGMDKVIEAINFSGYHGNQLAEFETFKEKIVKTTR